ncbi:xanthine dehydrogenase accessory protein XdhC [Halomonas halocynthiae]|uniref:xanthine dehydrogenase accessory protein XdhC n=1 Tax=Halomonas halocynthiae TaxID=176290 RepID=UPI000415B2A9|nr:xanthine dehydrogenase accessory protein XdhC [Halomonas halocynthiae]
MSIQTWHEALHQLQRDGRPHALATVVAAAGSTPREPGARMIITTDISIDTLGGGHFEEQVIETAQLWLASGEAGLRLEDFPLGGRSGQCCGGHVQVLIELFPAAEMQVALFGAGHVGRALAQVLAPLPWRIDWLDSRRDGFPETPAVERQSRHSYTPDESGIKQTVAKLAPGSHVLIMTHDHALDRALLDALLGRDDLASLGVIGSDSKWASFRRRLRDAGHSDERLAKVRCPIGVPGAIGKRPYEIALAVAAELLTLKTSLVTQVPTASRRGLDPALLRGLLNQAPAFTPSSHESPAYGVKHDG